MSHEVCVGTVYEQVATHQLFSYQFKDKGTALVKILKVKLQCLLIYSGCIAVQ